MGGLIPARGSTRTILQVNSGNQIWPNRKQPFRSQPRALALTPDGKKLYVALPGREGIPIGASRLSILHQRVLKLDRSTAAGPARGLRPIGVKVSPLNTSIYPRPYVSCSINTAISPPSSTPATTRCIGDFLNGLLRRESSLQCHGTRLYITDRFKDEVRAFRVDPGPKFTQIAEIPTGTTELERANPRDLDSERGWSHASMLPIHSAILSRRSMWPTMPTL